jgi:hypothetical protein
MLSKVKGFFSYLLEHWALTLLFVFAIVIFAVPMLGGVYDNLASRFSFLPGRKQG